MPASITQTRCTCCNHSRSMSIFEGICIECFDTRYLLCTDCGSLVRRSNTDRPYRSNRIHNLASREYRCNGAVYCVRCYDYHQDTQPNWWQPRSFDVSFATYRGIGSKRKFGVEIETASCSRRRELNGHTKFGCKSDPTVNGAEFDSPILYGDEGLACIGKFLEFADEHNWSADRSCGCHTHYDMRDEPSKKLYRIAYAYRLSYSMWKRCVPRQRREGDYCHSPEYNTRDLVAAFNTRTEFNRFAGNRDRYDYLNISAYRDHQTFENRLLEGTLDAEVICNWITVNCRFIDRVRDLTFRELRAMFGEAARPSYRALVDLIDDAALTDWVADRARYVGRRPLRGPDAVSDASAPRRRPHLPVATPLTNATLQ